MHWCRWPCINFILGNFLGEIFCSIPFFFFGCQRFKNFCHSSNINISTIRGQLIKFLLWCDARNQNCHPLLHSYEGGGDSSGSAPCKIIKIYSDAYFGMSRSKTSFIKSGFQSSINQGPLKTSSIGYSRRLFAKLVA